MLTPFFTSTVSSHHSRGDEDGEGDEVVEQRPLFKLLTPRAHSEVVALKRTTDTCQALATAATASSFFLDFAAVSSCYWDGGSVSDAAAAASATNITTCDK
jgi:hypothetical protein